MSQASRRGSAAAAIVLAAALAASGCSGDDDEPEPRSAGSSSATAPAEVVTTVTYGTITGRLPKPKRVRLVGQMEKVVDGWIDAAYVGGDYPRTRFADSWPGFTAGARQQAAHDAGLMSNKDIGAGIDGVVAKRRIVKLDVLAVKHRAVGVTARVVVRFATTGSKPRDIRVAGRLYLTRGKQGWKVFGYDMTKSQVNGASGGAA